MRPALLLSLLILNTSLAAAQTRWSFDFEKGIPPELELMNATIDNDKVRVINGSSSIMANLAETTGDWNEFLHTKPAVVFEKGKTYHVSFAYKVIAMATQETEFYSQLRSRSGQGDIQGNNWRWYAENADTGTIHRLFTVDKDDCFFMIGIFKKGILMIDDLVIEQTNPKFVPPNFQIKPGPDVLANLRKELDALRTKQELSLLLDDMLVIACNEGAGMKAAAATKTLELMEQFQIDFVDWNPLAPMARKWGVRTSIGGPEYQEFYKIENPNLEMYTAKDPRERMKKWSAFRAGNFAVNLEGTYQRYGDWGDSWFTCHNQDLWNVYWKKTTWDRASQKMSICQDNISAAPWLKGSGCFCASCQKKFREYLLERYNPGDLSVMGINNLASFSIQEYIVTQGLVGNEALNNPVVLEYIKFQHISQTLNWARSVKYFKDSALVSNRKFPVYGNQIGIGGMWPFAVLLSPFNDIVQIEEVLGIGEKLESSSIDYKMAHASGLHERPVWMRGPVVDDKRPGYPQTNVNFWTHHFAEALAAGGVRDFSFGYNMPPGSKKIDYLDDRKLMQSWADFARFTRNNRPLYCRRESAAKVALVYSIPSSIYRRFSPLQIDDGGLIDRHRKWAKTLDAWHIPYEVVIFGHPEMFDDTKSLARLQRYKALLFPNCDALTQAQIRALKRFQANGGQMYSAGPLGSRDENLCKRAAGEDPKFGEGIVLPDTNLDSIKDKLTAVSGVSGDLPETVQVNLWKSQEGRALDIHLLNYGIRIDDGTPTQTYPTVLTVEIPEGLNYTTALFIRPYKAMEEIPVVSRDGKAEIQLPSFDIYAVVSLTTMQRYEQNLKKAEERRDVDRLLVKQEAAQLNFY